jgi:hypothetical protein
MVWYATSWSEELACYTGTTPGAQTAKYVGANYAGWGAISKKQGANSYYTRVRALSFWDHTPKAEVYTPMFGSVHDKYAGRLLRNMVHIAFL